jgi:hypothetical protein
LIKRVGQVRVSGAESALAAPAASDAGFELLYVADEDGGRVERRGSLLQCWNLRFEVAPPVRGFSSFRGQRNFPGLWWSATTGEHVGFESWLERDHAMLLDFSSVVTGFASQPFWLLWWAGGRQRRHAPDFFVRQRDGAGVVVDVRPDGRIKPEDAEAFAATGRACELVGWSYRRVGELDPVLVANVRWLAGYRHPRCRNALHEALVVEAFRERAPLLETVRQVGEPIAVLPTVFHLLWSGVLMADLSGELLAEGSLVWTGGLR